MPSTCSLNWSDVFGDTISPLYHCFLPQLPLILWKGSRIGDIETKVKQVSMIARRCIKHPAVWGYPTSQLDAHKKVGELV